MAAWPTNAPDRGSGIRRTGGRADGRTLGDPVDDLRLRMDWAFAARPDAKSRTACGATSWRWDSGDHRAPATTRRFGVEVTELG